MFGVVRIALGGWLLLLPWIEDWGFKTLSVILFAMLLVSGLVGILFAPDTTGRDLSETQEGSPRGQRFTRTRAVGGAGQRSSLRNWWTIVSDSAPGRCASPSSRSSISSVHSCVCSSR